MKTSRIKHIAVHTVPVTEDRKAQIESVLSRIYADHVAKALDSLPLSGEEKARILKKIMMDHSPEKLSEQGKSRPARSCRKK